MGAALRRVASGEPPPREPLASPRMAFRPPPALSRERALLFGREAASYDRHRPGYPEVLIEAILAPDDPATLTLLDVACGPGTAGRQLASRGASVLGVEPNPQMAALAESHGIQCEVAAFEAWDAAGRHFDRVVCAQAWHWLDQQVATGKAAELLAPGGRLCLAWNVGWYPDPLAEALHDRYRTLLGDDHGLTLGYAAQRPGQPRTEFIDPLRASLAVDGRFAGVRVERFGWQQQQSAGDWVGELRSHSDHAALPHELRERLYAEVAATIDRFGGSFELCYESVLIDAVRG